MKTFVEFHAIQSVPPANMNRDDTGAPKTATYGGAVRARVSSQSWKRAMRTHFNENLDVNERGIRTKAVVQLIADAVTRLNPELAEHAPELAVSALTAAKLKPVKKSKKDDGPAEMTYLLFVSHQQIESVARLIVDNADAPDVAKALATAGVKKALDEDHSIDIALFGRMVAEAPEMNVDAACQVAHALGVHEVSPEYDYYTAVDDVTVAAEEAGAGMIGTVEFNSSTLYRYACVNVDLLRSNLGDDVAAKAALEAFARAFVESMPSGKQNTFANGTRPAALLVTVGTGAPASLVGAFEEPLTGTLGYLKPAVRALGQHAAELFDTWRRPQTTLATGLPDCVGELGPIADVVSFDDLVAQTVAAAFPEERA